jgi:hypothetical protein
MRWPLRLLTAIAGLSMTFLGSQTIKSLYPVSGHSLTRPALSIG